VNLRAPSVCRVKGSNDVAGGSRSILKSAPNEWESNTIYREILVLKRRRNYCMCVYAEDDGSSVYVVKTNGIVLVSVMIETSANEVVWHFNRTRYFVYHIYSHLLHFLVVAVRCPISAVFKLLTIFLIL
jgi:hypothetical protein